MAEVFWNGLVPVRVIYGVRLFDVMLTEDLMAKATPRTINLYIVVYLRAQL
jgi:hypothetical protein